MGKKTIILHTCCAPCVAYVHRLLKADYHVIPYYFNPNIAPRAEYDRRLSELERFSKLEGLPLIVGEYRKEEWQSSVSDFRFQGERSQRCWECYRFRIDAAFRMARETGAGLVGTVMSISPHKDAAKLNAIGTGLAGDYGLAFLEADFKKGDGYRRSVALSAEYGFYRQNYCGCLYSKYEKTGKRARTLRRFVTSVSREPLS